MCFVDLWTTIYWKKMKNLRLCTSWIIQLLKYVYNLRYTFSNLCKGQHSLLSLCYESARWLSWHDSFGSVCALTVPHTRTEVRVPPMFMSMNASTWIEKAQLLCWSSPTWPKMNLTNPLHADDEAPQVLNPKQGHQSHLQKLKKRNPNVCLHVYCKL